MGLVYGQEHTMNKYQRQSRPALMILPRQPQPSPDGSLSYYVPHFARLIRWGSGFTRAETATKVRSILGLQVWQLCVSAVCVSAPCL